MSAEDLQKAVEVIRKSSRHYIDKRNDNGVAVFSAPVLNRTAYVPMKTLDALIEAADMLGQPGHNPSHLFPQIKITLLHKNAFTYLVRDLETLDDVEYIQSVRLENALGTVQHAIIEHGRSR